MTQPSARSSRASASTSSTTTAGLQLAAALADRPPHGRQRRPSSTASRDRTRMLTQDEALVDINLAVQYRRADPVEVRLQRARSGGDARRGQRERDPRDHRAEQARLRARSRAARRSARRPRNSSSARIGAYNTGIEVISVNLQDVSVAGAGARRRRRTRSRRARTRIALPCRRRPTPTTSCRRRAARPSASSRARAPTRRASSRTRRARRRASARSPPNTSARPAVTRQRLYLETMEQVLGSSTKVIVDTKGTGNMIYLPLDKLLEQRGPQRHAGRRAADDPARGRQLPSRRRTRAPGRIADGRPHPDDPDRRRSLACWLLDECRVPGAGDGARDQVPASARSSRPTTSPACTS